MLLNILFQLKEKPKEAKGKKVQVITMKMEQWCSTKLVVLLQSPFGYLQMCQFLART